MGIGISDNTSTIASAKLQSRFQYPFHFINIPP
jgi:hypothetical protein